MSGCLPLQAGDVRWNRYHDDGTEMGENALPGMRGGIDPWASGRGPGIGQGKHHPSMPLETIAKSLEYAIEALAIDRADGGESAGDLH